MNVNRLAWGDLQIILAVARSGSLNQAAEQLGSSHPTLFRKVRSIEAACGATLFERSRQGYRPTEAALELLAVAEDFDQRLRDLSKDQSLEEGGRILLTTTEVFLPHVLPRALESFRRERPEVRIDLEIDDRLADIQRREADIALRAGGEPADDLVGRVICNLDVAAFAPLDWPAVSESAMADQPWVTLDDSKAHMASMRWLMQQGVTRRAVVRCNSTLGVARMAEAGYGLAMLPCCVGDRSPHLRRITPALPQFRSPLWLLSPKQLRGVPRISTALDILTTALRAQADLLEGRLPRTAGV